jgi:DNA-binding NtrC family response regulator
VDVLDTTLDSDNQQPVFVAVIDDETDLAYLFKEVLSQMALEYFKANHQNYRVVISDYKMPTMTGMELLSKIKGVNPAVTRIMMSAFEIQDELFQEYKCMDKFLQKPVLMTDLIDEVRMLVNKMQIPDTKRIS